MKIIAQMKFERIHFDVVVQHISHYTSGTCPQNITLHPVLRYYV